MVLACGPMNWMPSSPQRLAKVAFSERKPYPAAEGVNESSQQGSQPTKREVIGALSSEGYIPTEAQRTAEVAATLPCLLSNMCRIAACSCYASAACFCSPG